MTPSPPAWAIAIARAPSVTVSIAADMSGMPSSISRVMRVRVSVSPGRMLDAAGTSITSSKVSACRISIAPALGGLVTWVICRVAGPAVQFRLERQAARQLCGPAEALGDDVGLRRFGAARRRLGVAHLGEFPLQGQEEGAF